MFPLFWLICKNATDVFNYVGGIYLFCFPTPTLSACWVPRPPGKRMPAAATAEASKACLDGCFSIRVSAERWLQRGLKSEVWILPNTCLNEDLWVRNPLARCKVGSAESAASTEVLRTLPRPTSEQQGWVVSVHREDGTKRFKQRTTTFWDSLGRLQFNLEVSFNGIKIPG